MNTNALTRTPQRLLPVLALALLALVGCNSGESTRALPNTSAPPGGTNYNGPAPATADVQNFKRALWDNLAGADRCGSCHGADGQSPTFVHNGDINIAYAQANSVVNLDDPSQSLLVTKVAGGHNCWENNDNACADIITRYIENWAGGSSGSAKIVELRAPIPQDVGNTKIFPSDSSAFGAGIYNVLSSYCSSCHVEGVQTPYIASTDVDVAYAAAQSRINLQEPANSRLVVRLREEFHNCWDNDCEASAAFMQGAIEAFAAGIEEIAVDPDLVTSKALNLLADGLVANAGGRFEDHVIALYEFKAGEGNQAFDTSGIEPALHLSLTGNVKWVGGWGIEIGAATEDEVTGARLRNGKAQGSTAASRKLHNLITASGEYSLEAWVVPANTSQEDARILTYAGSSTARNLTLGQNQQNYEVLHRSSTTSQNTAFATATADNRVQASLQHLVATFSPGQGRRLYVNGEPTGDIDPNPPGLFNEWDDSFALVLGNDADGNSLWQGTLKMVAIHNRALTDSQVRANFAVGVGQRYFLLFGVSHLIDVPQSYIVFEASQFDSYSYLFSEPFFISLDPAQTPQSIPLRGLRIGINGKPAAVGQAFANLDTSLGGEQYMAGRGQPLSRLGTIVGLESGPDKDVFFLSFERLGSHTNVIVEGAIGTTAPPYEDPPSAHRIGLRTFDEINASMAQMTGVATTHSGVARTFNTVRQQLPTVANIEGFLSAHQMAVTQLAIQYCNALVSDTSLRASVFPGFNFSASAASAFDTTGRERIITPLLNRMVGQNLASQPTTTELRTELNALIDTLTQCGGSCAPDRTETVVKASCAAVLGSATTLVQ